MCSRNFNHEWTRINKNDETIQRQRRASNLEPGATLQGSVETQTPAVKAQFSFQHVQKLDESRFQCLFTRESNSRGDAPGLSDTAPLALNAAPKAFGAASTKENLTSIRVYWC
jgi:hypothetical protein